MSYLELLAALRPENGTGLGNGNLGEVATVVVAGGLGADGRICRAGAAEELDLGGGALGVARLCNSCGP